jgi:hypothetical protein
MAVLNKATLTTNLTTAFTNNSWAATATQFTAAVNSYIQTASAIEIDIAGAWTALPNTGGIALGICTATTTASATLLTACGLAFALNLWTGVSAFISAAISTLLTTSTVVLTSYTTVPDPLLPLYTFGGVGVAAATITVDPANIIILTSKINTAFITGTVWATVASDIATAIDDFIKTAKVTTVVVPPPSGNFPQQWVGKGGDIGGYK